MSVPRDEDLSEIRVSDTTSIAFQSLEEERASLKLQRRHLAALQLQYALLNALSQQIDQQEAMLVSEEEHIRMTGIPGKMLSSGLLKR